MLLKYMKYYFDPGLLELKQNLLSLFKWEGYIDTVVSAPVATNCIFVVFEL